MTDHARLTVTLDEAVTAGRNTRSDFRQDVHDHVPGSVLRGALAARWIRHHGNTISTTPEFTAIFEGEGSFGPLHCAASLPIPLSVRVHKYAHSRDCRQLWWDEALDESTSECPQCQSPVEASKGQPRGTVETTERTMAALSTDGVALDGSLFSQKSLRAGLQLQGWLHGAALQALHLDGSPITTLLLGSRRSLRGSATVELDTETAPEPVECVGNDVLLRLASPGVFVDDFGLPRNFPTHAELSEALGVHVLDVRPWARWEEVGGWHVASGLPKPTERAVSAGSTYRVRCAEQPSEAARRRIMARGIGLRRREGYGALYRIEAPLGLPAWTNKIAPLRRRPNLLPAFRQRLDELRKGNVDDTRFHNALQKANFEADYAEAFRTMLSVDDAELYATLLTFLEER